MECASDALSGAKPALRLFDIKLLDAVNKISGKVLDQPLNINYRPPAQFTGELLRVEYLYDQSNFTLDGNADTDIDEGAEVDDGYWEESEVEIPCVMDPNVLSTEQEASDSAEVSPVTLLNIML